MSMEDQLQTLKNQENVYHTFDFILKEGKLQKFLKKIPQIAEDIYRAQEYSIKKKKIQNFSQKILGQSKKVPNLALPETSEISDMPDRKMQAFRIMLPRLAYFGEVLVKDLSGAKTFYRFLFAMRELYDTNVSERLFYNLPQVFNATRALIDTAQSALNAEKYVTMQNSSPFQLNQTQQKIFKGVLHFYRTTVLASPLMRNSLEIIKNSDKLYKCLNVDDMINQMQKFSCQFVKNVDYIGMVHFGGIFLNANIFANHSDKELEAFLLLLLIHEGFHYCTRSLTNNFAWVTPGGSDVRKDLEGGYLLETCIWGDHRKKVWMEPSIVMNSSRWNNGIFGKCLFTEEEIARLTNRAILNDRCSGLCVIDSELGMI